MPALCMSNGRGYSDFIFTGKQHTAVKTNSFVLKKTPARIHMFAESNIEKI
jgi:hypothetical protein